MRDEMVRVLNHDFATAAASTNGNGKSHETLREKADRVAREHAPVTIASYEC